MATVPQFTDTEILAQFRDFLAKQGQGPQRFEPGKNHPMHRGVEDQSYVRPAPQEFPKMMHHPSGLTKIVQNREEQKALESSWSETPTKREPNWRSKLGEVQTKFGMTVREHHIAFLQSAGIEGIASVRDAAQFLDQLTQEEQESFFREAEMQIEEGTEAPKHARRKKEE